MANLNAISRLLDCDATDSQAIIDAFAGTFGAAVDARVAAANVAASDITITDSGAYTATTEVESALAEIYSKLPVTDFLAADFTADSGGTGATPTATGLAVSVKASRSYIVEATLYATATVNGGIEISFTGPAAATAVLQADIFQDAGNIVNDGEMDLTGAVNYIAAALAFDKIQLTGVLTVDATAGTFTILGAQDTGHADTTTIHAGSFVKLTPII